MPESPHILFDPVQRMVCPFCRARMDVSTIAPFNKAVCPSCGNEVTVPARLGDFLLTELLGMGGMGGVYRAHDETLGRDVAIKVMLKSLGDNPEFVTTFRREAQAAAKLNHPNIAQIYSFGQEKGQPYIVMELVPGAHFDEMISGPEPLDVPTIMKIGADIASGLQMAADNNLIHGDIKPENILMDERNTAKLLDFGIAAKPSKGENEIWGTPYYIAPERVRRQRVDFRSDIYCLGGTLYHAVTQRPPFEGADAIEVVRARLLGPPEPPEKYRPDLDPEVSAIIMRMLQAEPAMRYPNYSSLLSDMRKYLARVQPKAPTATSSRRFVIKGSKAAAAAAAEKAAGGTRSLGGTGRVTGRVTGPISRTRPMVVTRGMFPDAGVAQDTASDTDTSEKQTGTGRKKGVLTAVLILVGLGVAGGVGAWLLHQHKQKTEAGRLEAERKEVSRWQADVTALHGNLMKGVTLVAGIEAQGVALVTQAVALVEQELGDAYTARILEEPPEPDPLPLLDDTIDPALLAEGGADPFATNVVAEAEGGEATETDEVAVAEATAAVDGTTEEAAAEEAAAENDAVAAEDALAAADESPAVELEPLSPLAQMARDVHEATWPAKAAMRLAQELATLADALLASSNAGTNSLASLKDIRQQLASMTKELDGERINATQALTAAREKLETLASECQRLVKEREEAAAEEQRLAAEKAAREEEERKAAELRESIRAEVVRVASTVAMQKEAILKHQYAQVLRELRAIQGEFKHKEGRQAIALAIQRVERLQHLRDFMIKRLNEVPYKDPVGWSVEKATPRGITLRTAMGAVSDVAWENVDHRAMAGFIRFYIFDEQQSKKLRLRERHAQTINAIVYTLAFGGDTEDARALIKTLGQRAMSMMPSERAATLALLPELEPMLK